MSEEIEIPIATEGTDEEVPWPALELIQQATAENILFDEFARRVERFVTEQLTFGEARDKMANAFVIDEDLHRAYQDNIAMFLHDRCNITDYEERNQRAKELLDLIFNS